MYLLGYDIGSSSIKAALVDVESGTQVAVAQQPKVEMEMIAEQPGWAEQQPEEWWKHLCNATRELLEMTGIDSSKIQGIGIAYQMHGLVMLDANGQSIRPSIIWCDSRAVGIGNDAFTSLGEEQCLSHLLNSPGNFTASKLRWVQQYEPDKYAACDKIMLPGDYIAYKLSGEINTTISGLSEGMLWDFKEKRPANLLLDHYEVDETLLPEIRGTFAVHGQVSKKASHETGLIPGIPITYRAGDQPNNALSLNVLQPGEVAATGGTSGVVYGVVDQPIYDPQSRVNGFAHVNYTDENPLTGILLCINGAGIQYGWVRKQLTGSDTSYDMLESIAAKAPVGSDGLSILPFGNGAERMLGNREIGAHFVNIQLNRHERAHVYRATLEGIAFSFVYGMQILGEMGMSIEVIKVGNDNLFLSNIFSETIATLTDAKIEMLKTTGAVGAALAAGVGAEVFPDLSSALAHVSLLQTIHPRADRPAFQEAYANWEHSLKRFL
ncbi:MAG: carbohydrate kinase [Saprospiraceae bacterium]|nr:carbohydrate kinase [Saprospiraceae bacterium]